MAAMFSHRFMFGFFVTLLPKVGHSSRIAPLCMLALYSAQHVNGTDIFHVTLLELWFRYEGTSLQTSVV